MKNLALIFSLFSFYVLSQNQKFSLNKVGKPIYQKELQADRGLIVYSGDGTSFVQVLPKEYYNVGGCTDTLILTLKEKAVLDNNSQQYLIGCSNCNEISFNHIIERDTNYFVFSKGNDYIKFVVTFERKPHGMHSAPPLAGEKKDTLIGFVRLKNTFIHYTPVASNVNIGIIDKNFNGRIDSTDYIALSDDEYFFTTHNDKSQVASKVKTILVNGIAFDLKIIDHTSFKISLERNDKFLKADIEFNDSLANINFGNEKLYDLLDSYKFVLLSYWSEFCSPCIKGITTLNKLSENIAVIGLYSGNSTLNEVVKRYSIEYQNIDCPENVVSTFNFNGFPNYVLIDKSRKVLLNTRDLDEIVKLIE